MPCKNYASHALAAPHPEGRGGCGMVQVADVQDQDLQRIGGQQPVVRPQQPALVVAPRLDLHIYDNLW